MTQPPSSARRRLVPGWFLSTLLLVLAAGCYACFRWEITPDHAADHLIGMSLALLAWLLLLGWFAFYSGYPRLLRRGVLAGAVVGLVGFLALFQPQFSGEMIPAFRFRYAPAPDQRLETLVARGDPGAVDLTLGAGDFPRYLGPAGQGGVDAAWLAPSWGSPPRPLWRQPIGAGWSGFSAAGDYAVTLEQRGDQELLSCYRLRTGEPVWTNAVNVRHETVMGGIGPRSTPTIAQGNVYAVGATGILRCVDGSTGESLWTVDLVEAFGSTPSLEAERVAWGRATSPLVVDDLVIVPAGGSPERQKSLAAYDRQSGALRWAAGDSNISYSSPVEAELGGVRQVVVVNEDNVAGHRLEDGELLWSFSWPGSSFADANTSQPLVLPGDRVLASKGYGAGAGLWQVQRQGEAWEAAALWRNARVLRTKLTSSLHHEGFLYGLSDGVLQCVRADDGSLVWKGRRLWHGQLLRSRDLLLALSEKGELVLARCSPESYQELGEASSVVDGKCWNNLALANNLLLVRSDVEAACYELPTVDPPSAAPAEAAESTRDAGPEQP